MKTHRHTQFLFGWVAFVLLALLGSAKPHLDVYLLAGETNMQGYGKNSELPPALQVAQAHLIATDGDSTTPISPLAPGKGHTAAMFGPELAFGLTLPNQAAFLKFTADNATLPAWLPNGAYFGRWMNFTHYQLSVLSQSYDVTVKAIIWEASEADAGNRAREDAYLSDMTSLIKAVRSQYAVPFVILGMPFGTRYDVLRQQQASLAYSGLAQLIPTNGNPLMPDGVHYTSDAYIQVGLSLQLATGSQTPTATESLVNLSVRVTVSSEPLSVGFVVAKSSNLLLRAVGPTLLQYGVTNAMSFPVLRLYKGNQLVAVSQSNDIGTEIAAERVGAFPLTSARDAAMLITLPPGIYTLQVGDLRFASGNVLVEAYLVN